MSTPVLDTFLFGGHQVTIRDDLYDDMIFFAQDAWCDWLLEHNGWRYLDEACRWLHPDHVQMLADWATTAVEKLPEEIRHPVDGTVHDVPTLIRYLAAALPWKVANRKLNEAHMRYGEGAPTIASEEAVRAAARDLIDAALEYPRPIETTGCSGLGNRFPPQVHAGSGVVMNHLQIGGASVAGPCW